MNSESIPIFIPVTIFCIFIHFSHTIFEELQKRMYKGLLFPFLSWPALLPFSAIDGRSDWKLYLKFYLKRLVSNFIQNSVANFIASSFHERSIKERTFTCPVCWALFGSPLSLPQLHFTVWPLMSVLCTATIACVADSLVENLKYNQTTNFRLALNVSFKCFHT